MPEFTFDARAQRFRQPNGRFLSPSSVRAIIDTDIEATKGRMQSLARELQRGAITSDEFQSGMIEEIKSLHLAEVATARGGAERMRQSDYGRAGQKIRQEYSALAGLMNDIEGDPDFIHGVAGRMDFMERVGMYAESGRGTYAAAKDSEMRAANFKTKWNKLDAASQHCTGERSCIAMTNLGKVAIDDPRYILEGQRKCNVRCQCETVYGMAVTS